MSTRFACPRCGAPLTEYVCSACGVAYGEVEGIRVFSVVDTTQKRDQAAFFDDVTDPDFEIERPAGLPRFHHWLLSEKFAHAVADLRPDGKSVLVVCGGSGMDAEFLAAAGAEVTTSDVSLGAAVRARVRAERHEVSYESIVADVEHLPFPDDSFDVVYVHDGLHHLVDPLAGLVEMARVATEAVCVTEPAQAALTSAAVRFGLALETEDAGNRVARLAVEDVTRILRDAGFTHVRGFRYPMLYRHEPGAPTRLASTRLGFPIACAAMRILLRFGRSFGNKLVVVARRPEAT